MKESSSSMPKLQTFLQKDCVTLLRQEDVHLLLYDHTLAGHHHWREASE